MYLQNRGHYCEIITILLFEIQGQIQTNLSIFINLTVSK